MITTETTTFTLDNMGRFLCNTLQEAIDSTAPLVGGRKREFDAIVIGGGTFGAVLGRPENLRHFGLARADDSELGGDAVQLPRVQSIRSSRRVGPDGQIVFDLVAEVTQRRTVNDPRGAFEVFGGATVIIGPKGEFRYVIAKNILNEGRLRKLGDFIHGPGKQYWERRGNALTPIANAFKLLHDSKHP